MNTITKYNTNWSSLPTIFTPTLIDRFFNEYGDDWYAIKDTYPYNITQKRDKSGEILGTNITFALAGVSKEQLSVKIEDGSLTVAVNKVDKAEQEDVEVHYLHRGISNRSMKIKFNLYNVDTDKISSSFRDGMLEIELPTKTKTIKTISID
jgi:HSP20 family molecular chaperone IbpA